ncbi:MAG: hypothetical protein BKP49_04795 [Treponema sp. CETP13]|nr:MAG: hypothetical protein BKP49_04795 [Treponema sp. CETP13]
MNIKTKRIIMSVFGMSILGVVVALLRKANLGVDPFTSFVVGVGNIFNTTYGIMFPILTGIFLIAVFFIDKHFIGIATILNLVIIGPVADITLKGLNLLYDASNIWIQIVTLFIALVILCIASALYIVGNLGVSSYDALSLILAEKLEGKKWGQYRFCRMFTDIICVIIGFSTGAVIGIGTVITAFFMGPFTQFFIIHLAKPLLYGKITETSDDLDNVKNT